MSKVVKTVSGSAVPILGNDIDTDRITPARFLKEITFENMGNYLFYDERKDQDGNSLDHPLDQSKFKGASVLIVGSNFGCGSSREHAPQAIMRAGFSAILGISFSEIFAGNCKNLGIPTLRISKDVHREFINHVEGDPTSIFTIDIESLSVSVNDQVYSIDLPKDWQIAFLTGEWNAIATLKSSVSKILEKDKTLPYQF